MASDDEQLYELLADELNDQLAERGITRDMVAGKESMPEGTIASQAYSRVDPATVAAPPGPSYEGGTPRSPTKFVDPADGPGPFSEAEYVKRPAFVGPDGVRYIPDRSQQRADERRDMGGAWKGGDEQLAEPPVTPAGERSLADIYGQDLADVTGYTQEGALADGERLALVTDEALTAGLPQGELTAGLPQGEPISGSTEEGIDAPIETGEGADFGQRFDPALPYGGLNVQLQGAARTGGGVRRPPPGSVDVTGQVVPGSRPEDAAAMQAAGRLVQAAAEEEERIAIENSKIDGELATMVREANAVGVEEHTRLIRDVDEEVRRRSEQIDSAIEAVRSQRIDPTRLFSRSGSATVGAALSIAAGQLAAQLGGGENTALGIIERAIDRDLAAQEREMQDGMRGIGARMNMLAQVRGIYDDRETRNHAMRALHLEHAAARIAEMRNQYTGRPEVLQRFDAARAQLLQQAAAARDAENRRNGTQTYRSRLTEMTNQAAFSSPDAIQARQRFVEAQRQHQQMMQMAEQIRETAPEQADALASMANQQLEQTQRQVGAIVEAILPSAGGRPAGGSGRARPSVPQSQVGEVQRLVDGGTLTHQEDGTYLYRGPGGSTVEVPATRDHFRHIGGIGYAFFPNGDASRLQEGNIGRLGNIATHATDIRSAVQELRHITRGQVLETRSEARSSRVNALISRLTSSTLGYNASLVNAGTIGESEAVRMISDLGPIDESIMGQISRTAAELISGRVESDHDRLWERLDAFADVVGQAVPRAVRGAGGILLQGRGTNAPRDPRRDTPGVRAPVMGEDL